MKKFLYKLQLLLIKISSIREISKKNVSMLITTPFEYCHDDAGHVHHFMNEIELRNHLEKYVTVKNIVLYKDAGIFAALCEL